MLFGDFVHFLIEKFVQVIDELRCGCPPGGVLFEVCAPFERFWLLAGDILAGMADARGRSHHDGDLVPLREIEGLFNHFLGLAGGGGVEDGDLGEMGEETAVLFCLGTIGAGIIGRNDDKAPFDTEVG